MRLKVDMMETLQLSTTQVKHMTQRASSVSVGPLP